jgi:mannosyl-3-phosphoglycerate phosphatase
MGSSDKADGQRAAKTYCESIAPAYNWLVVTLGDSPNDLGMLNGADIAVVIKNPSHLIRLEPTAKRCLYPAGLGPVAWNEAIFTILNSTN